MDVERVDSRLADPRPGIRKAALAMAAYAWAVAVGFFIYRGAGGWHAAGIATILALGGFGSWWAYHLISRRNDGLLIPLVGVISCLAPMSRVVVASLLQTAIMSSILVALTCRSA